jgi:hypothetical protein
MDIYTVGKVQSTADQRLGVIRHGFNIIGVQSHPIVSIAFESKEEADAAHKAMQPIIAQGEADNALPPALPALITAATKKPRPEGPGL